MSDLFNTITRWLLIGYWPLLGIWELILVLYLRQKYPGTQTISAGAESLAMRGFSTLAYFWGGMAGHFFLPWKRPLWQGTIDVVLSVLFWVIGAAYLLADTIDPRRTQLPPLVQWFRLTWVAVLTGLLAGCLLFGQKALAEAK